MRRPRALAALVVALVAFATLAVASTPPPVTFVTTPSAPDGEHGYYRSVPVVEVVGTTGASVLWCVDAADACEPDTPYASPVRIAGGERSYFRYRAEGGEVVSDSLSFLVDLDDPSVSTLVSPAVADGLAGWRVTRPLVTLSATDGTSGIASLRWCIDAANACAPSTDYAEPVAVPDSTGSWLRYRAADVAGRHASGALFFRVDTVAPTATVSGSEGALGSKSAAVVIAFSEPMDRASALAALTGAGSWLKDWSADSTLLYLNNSALGAGPHSLTLGASARDAHGVPLAAPVTRDLVAPGPPAPTQAPSTPPGAPTGVRATPGATSVALSWSAPASDSPITGYRVYRGASSSALAEVAVAGGTSHTSEGLEPGATYWFQVAAINAAGTGPRSGVVSARVGALAPVTTLLISPAVPDGDDGWYTSAPTATLVATPAEARILYALDGGAERAYAGPVTLPAGATTLAYRATLEGAPDEAARSARVKVDLAPPTVTRVGASSTSVAAGSSVTITADVADAHSGLAGATAVLTSASGPSASAAMGGSGATRSATLTLPAPGAWAVTVVARDTAGNSASAGGPTVTATGAPVPPTGGASPGGGDGPDVPLESTGPSSGSPSVNGAPGSQGQVLILAGDRSTEPGENVQGGVRVKVANVPDVSRTIIVLIAPDGTETVIGEGVAEADWDTTKVENGFYVVETRERQADGSWRVVASTTVFVFNPRASPGEAIAGMAAGIAVAVAVSAAISAVTSGGMSFLTSLFGPRFLDFFGLARESAIAVGEDRLRERSQRRRGVGATSFAFSAATAVFAVALLGVFFAFEAMQGWDWATYLAALPIVGGAAVVFFAIFYGSETLLARASGALTRFRLLVAGGLALLVSGVLFRNCFGYAGYVQKNEIGDDSAEEQRRLAALRVLSVFGGILATTALFLLVGRFWRFDFAEAGMAIALTTLATMAMPLRPLPGSEVWKWSRTIALSVMMAAFALYFAFQIALVPRALIAALGVLGAVAYVAGWWRVRRIGRALADAHDGEHLHAPPEPAAAAPPAGQRAD